MLFETPQVLAADEYVNVLGHSLDTVHVESKRSRDCVVDPIGTQPLGKHVGCLVHLRDSHKELVRCSERRIYGSVRRTHASEDTTISQLWVRLDPSVRQQPI